MSLTTCIKRMGAMLTTDDKRAIVVRAKALRDSGLDPNAAALQAVQEQQFNLQTLLNDAEGAAVTRRPLSPFTPPAPPFEKESNEPTRPVYFVLSDFGIAGKAVESFINRYNRWKQAIDQVVAQGGEVNEQSDFVKVEQRYWGKVGAQIEDFQAEIESFIKSVVTDNVTLEDVVEYAYAQHAQERNAYIAAKRASMPDGGSGMTNADAKDIIDRVEKINLTSVLQKHTETLRGFSATTRKTLNHEGLIDDAENSAWAGMFKFYIPLRGVQPANDDAQTDRSVRTGAGRGFDIRGKESKTAKGRRSRAVQVIENVILDRTKVLQRSGKNEVLRALLRFVLDNPSANLWRVDAVESVPVSKLNDDGERIIVEQDAIVKDERTVALKDGGRQIYITIGDATLLAQLKNLNQEQLPRWIGAMLSFNRYLARMYTSLSPVFPFINFLRDIPTAGFGALDKLGFEGTFRMYANLPKAIMESSAAEFGKKSADYQNFRFSGGKTGFFNAMDLDQQTRQLTALVKNAKRSALNPLKIAPKIIEVIESIGAALENSNRLAAFKAAKEMGRSNAEAGNIAKNLTVNFNQRGSMGPQLSAWFLFFNPAVQGTARMIEALKSRKVLAVLGAAMTGMFLLTLRNASMGEDDDGVAWWDKIPDEAKERNIIIILAPGQKEGEPIPGSKIGRYIKIPMPYGYNTFAVIAMQAADTYRRTDSADPLAAKRGVAVNDGLGKVVKAFMGSWMPLPELGAAIAGDGDKGNSAILAGLPDSVSPIAQNILNTNAFGRDISPRDARNDAAIANEGKVFPGQRGTIYQSAAQGLNRATGGSQLEPGLIDMTPGQVENLARGYVGGPLTFVTDITNAVYARQNLKRDEVDMRRLPFVKQFYGQIDDETDRSTYMARANKARNAVDLRDAAETQLKKGAEDKDEGLLKIITKDDPLYMLGDELVGVQKRLTALRERESFIVLDSAATDSQKLIGIAELNRERRSVMQQFNAAYDLSRIQQAKIADIAQ